MQNNATINGNPKISIVMGVFRGLESLPVTVESILQQTFTDFEIVIVDDGNCPADSALIRETAKLDARIRVLRLEVNSGLTRALVKGCAESKGIYIARIDNGDLMVPSTRLEDQYNTLEKHRNLALVSGAIIILDLLNKDAYQSRIKEVDTKPFGKGDPKIKQICHVAVMFRANDYRLVGGYNETVTTGQDQDLWPRILSKGQGLLMNKAFAVAPMRTESISVAKNNIQYSNAIARELSHLRSGHFSIKPIFTICGHLIKRRIPISLRVKLRYRKNFVYIGKYASEDISLVGVSKWYRSKFG